MDKGINGVTALGFGLKEYIKMFGLTDIELEKNILDCRAGASCFAAEMQQQGKTVTACDPLYQLPVEKVEGLVLAAKESLKKSFSKGSHEFSILPDKANEFIKTAEQGIPVFLQDLKAGLGDKRYTADSLPNLSFANEQFELALVCHYLFTFSEQMTAQDHLEAIEELVRVANEVRIFPLVTYSGKLSPFVGEVVAMLQADGCGVEIRGVDYELQKEGNAMLRVWSEACSVEAHAENQ